MDKISWNCFIVWIIQADTLYLLLQYCFNVFGRGKAAKDFLNVKHMQLVELRFQFARDSVGYAADIQRCVQKYFCNILPCNLKLATLHFNLIHMKLKGKKKYFDISITNKAFDKIHLKLSKYTKDDPFFWLRAAF